MTTWGESHGAGVGVVVDGCPAGLALCEEDVQRYLDRRKPGQSRFTTKRSESDTVEILSGVFEGRTTGTPISMLVRNQDQHSKDYSEIASYYRPGHADYTFDEKYGSPSPAGRPAITHSTIPPAESFSAIFLSRYCSASAAAAASGIYSLFFSHSARSNRSGATSTGF